MAEIVNARTLAKRLGVRHETVLAWARRKLIPSLRASRRPVLFDLAEVERVLKERAGSLPKEEVKYG